MGVRNYGQAPQGLVRQPNNQPEQAPAGEDKPFEKSVGWLNIGISLRDAKGNLVDFAQISRGVATNALKHVTIPALQVRADGSSNRELRNRLIAANMLTDQIWELDETVPDGETRMLQLEVQYRKVRSDVVPEGSEGTTEETNPFLGALANLLAG